MTHNPTLSEMRATLAHKAVDGGVSTLSTKPSSDKKDRKDGKGGGKFDESKVKRDGDGQFARKDAGDKKELSWAEANKLDTEWADAKNLKKMQKEAYKKFTKRTGEIIAEKAKKYGVDIKTAKMKDPKVKTMIREAVDQLAKEVNADLKSTGADLSPSGRRRLEYYRDDEMNLQMRVVGNVDNSASIAKTKTTIREIRKSAAPGPDTTPMFNPDADISTGKVREAEPVVDVDDDGEEDINSWLKRKLAMSYFDENSLSHAERTIQNILDEMTTDEWDLQALIVGAALADTDLWGNPEVTSQYNALTLEKRYLIDFIVGNILMDNSALHSDDSAELMHFGVKGMKWGVRNVDRPAGLSTTSANTPHTRALARVAVKGGSATLGEAHLAALKSTGHRAVNAFTGDKTFWKRTAIVAGVAVGGLAVAVASPVILPGAVLAGLGEVTAAAFMLPTAGGVVVNLGSAAPLMTTASLGAATAKMVLIAGTGAGAAAATAVNIVGNTSRAILGNAQIDRSYAALGKTMLDRQFAGTKRTRKILNKAGSIAKKDLKQSDNNSDELFHVGVKGMKWGVRRDERPLGERDKALNMSQRSQVRVASTISALAATGMSMNAAATLFTLQARIERYQAAAALLKEVENHPLLDDASKEAVRRTKSHIMQGIIGSAMATTAVSIAIGVVTQRTAKAYFAPMHKVYGDSKPKINADLRKLSKDIKTGKRPHLTVKDYNKEVGKIVEKHMTSDKKNLLSPFHELARQQMGLDYNTKKLDIKFEKLPNTDLYDKMTVVTPHGLKLVKAVRRFEHSDLYEDSDPVGNVDLFFDYKFDSEGFIEEWSCPTLEVAHEMLEGKFDMESIASRFDPTNRELAQTDISDDENSLTHFGIKGMKWGIRRTATQLAGLAARRKSSDSNNAKDDDEDGTTSTSVKGGGSTPIKVSEDAARIVAITQKPPIELSNKEIQDVLMRANIVKQYDQLLNPSRDPNSELQQRVQTLRLEREYRQLKAEMTPPTVRAKVKNLIGSAAKTYGTYNKLDKQTGGELSKNINDAMKLFQGKNAPGKHRGTSARVTKIVASANKKKNKTP